MSDFKTNPSQSSERASEQKESGGPSYIFYDILTLHLEIDCLSRKVLKLIQEKNENDNNLCAVCTVNESIYKYKH